MFNFTNPRGYEGLFEKLATLLGLDLTRAIDREIVSKECLKRLISHCAACGDSECCRKLLAAKGHEIDRPPDFCPNSRVIMHLKSLTSDDIDEN